jgi:hypothetical protein
MNLSRSADYLASLWGLIVSGLLLLSSSPVGDANARLFWWYSVVSLVFYGTFGLLTFRRAVFGVLSRFALVFVAVLLALVGGAGGLVFFAVPIAMIALGSVSSRFTAK